MTTKEIVDAVTQRIYGKPLDRLSPEEREDLRKRLEKIKKEK